jgi:hypothetical protein
MSAVEKRTDRWLQLRKESRVTGSTLFRALGLATLREQQEHFDFVYYRLPLISEDFVGVVCV